MIVIDTSALVAVLAGVPVIPALDDRIWGQNELHAPHLIDVEFSNALRQLSRAGLVSEDRASDLIGDLIIDARLVRYRHDQFLERIWSLRHNLTAYDAAFVALAEGLDLPLITADKRIAQAAGHEAIVEVYALVD